MEKKLILPVIFGMLFLCSCSKDFKNIPDNDSLGKEGNAIPIEEALASLEEFMIDEGYIMTKGDINDHVQNYFPVSEPATKSGEATGNVLYAVNFKNDAGYALLSADRRIEGEIIAVTESGSVSIDDFVHNDFIHITSKYQNISENEFNELVESGVLDITENNLNSLLLDSVCKQINIYRDDSIGCSGGDKHIKYGPYIETKWGQDSPFNSCMNGNAVGCAPVAAAQIVYFHHENLKIEPIFCGYQCDWDTIGSVYHYTTIDSMTSEVQKKQIGHFMLDVKNKCNMKVSQTSGAFWNVEACLNNYGFKNIYHDFAPFGGNSHDQRHMEDVVTSLEYEKPVIMLAFCMAWGMEWCGHVYVIDGYKKDSTGEYFHINWGWTGKQDGYYARGCFDLSCRDSIENGFDSGAVENDPVNFNITHYYVHYEL